LEDFLANKEFDPEIKSLVWSGNHVMSVLQTAKEERGMILPRGMKEEVQIMGAYHRLLSGAQSEIRWPLSVQVVERTS